MNAMCLLLLLLLQSVVAVAAENGARDKVGPLRASRESGRATAVSLLEWLWLVESSSWRAQAPGAPPLLVSLASSEFKRVRRRGHVSRGNAGGMHWTMFMCATATQRGLRHRMMTRT